MPPAPLALSRPQLLQKRGDLSQFLIHLTRSGNLKQWADLHGNPQDNWVPIDAKRSLEQILKQSAIGARSPFGYFNLKVKWFNQSRGLWSNPNSNVNRKWLLSVCFTETPVDHIHLQCSPILGRQNHFKPYGLAFFESWMRDYGANPVFYVETQNKSLRAALDAIPILPNCSSFKDFMPLVEGFGSPWFGTYPTEVDFRWEREWRVIGDFMFKLPEVAFGLCPSAEIPYFEKLVGGAFLFVDPFDLPDSIKAKLKTDPRLANIK